MKNLILIIAIVFSGMLVQAQSDLDITHAIMGKQASNLQSVADSLNVALAFDGNDKLYVTVDGTTFIYKLFVTTRYKRIIPNTYPLD